MAKLYCKRLFCARCKVPWPPENECEEYQILNENERRREDLVMMELAKVRKWPRCPMCRFYVKRIDGCLYMKRWCGFVFGYNCMTRVTEHYCTNYLHGLWSFVNAVVAVVLLNPACVSRRHSLSTLAICDRFSDSNSRCSQTALPAQEKGFAVKLRRRSGSHKLVEKVHAALQIEKVVRESSNSNDSSFICEICAEPKSKKESFSTKGCSHYFCSKCIVKYVATKVQESIPLIRCPEPGCRGVLEPQLCRSILPQELFDCWADSLCDTHILGIQRYYCPYKDCSAPLEYNEGKVVEESECPHCHRLFCAQCKVPWHLGIECKEFQKLNEDEREGEDVVLMNLVRINRWQRCPLCRFCIERTRLLCYAMQVWPQILL